MSALSINPSLKLLPRLIIPAVALVWLFSGGALQAGSPLETLRTKGAKITEANGVVTQIQVTADEFTEADYRALGQIKTLKKLTISGKTLNDQTLPLLAGLADLEELSTNQTVLSDEGYRHFKAFPKLRMLALFHPSWDFTEFTGKGLAHLKDLPHLERLTFAGSTAGDDALAAIGELTQLREFRTWHTMQTQAGNEHLLKLTNLKSLRIGQRLPRGPGTPAPSFDESTIPVISQMKSLERLELTEARLSGDSLLALKQLPHLKQLLLQTTDISDKDVEQLRTALGDVKVVVKPLTEEEREMLTKKLKL